jgi:hypothetical protein
MNFPCTTSPFTAPTLNHRVSLSLASSPPGSAFYDISVRRLAGLLQASFRPRLTAWPLPFASSCHSILDRMVILLQGTCTPSVHALGDSEKITYPVHWQFMGTVRLIILRLGTLLFSLSLVEGLSDFNRTPFYLVDGLETDDDPFCHPPGKG